MLHDYYYRPTTILYFLRCSAFAFLHCAPDKRSGSMFMPSKRSGELVYLMYIQQVNPKPSHPFLPCYTPHLVLDP